MTAPKKVMRPANREMTAEDLPRYLQEYLKEKDLVDELTGRVNAKKAVIKKFVEQSGYADEKGSLFVDVDGVPGVSAVKLERRVSTGLDRSKAEAWLKKQGLWEAYSEVQRVLDEDALYAAAYEGKIAKKTMDGFITESESFAFKTVK